MEGGVHSDECNHRHSFVGAWVILVMTYPFSISTAMQFDSFYVALMENLRNTSITSMAISVLHSLVPVNDSNTSWLRMVLCLHRQLVATA